MGLTTIITEWKYMWLSGCKEASCGTVAARMTKGDIWPKKTIELIRFDRFIKL